MWAGEVPQGVSNYPRIDGKDGLADIAAFIRLPVLEQIWTPVGRASAGQLRLSQNRSYLQLAVLPSSGARVPAFLRGVGFARVQA